VLRALSTPLLGHLDPVFLTVMNGIQASLRMIFETEHRFTEQALPEWKRRL
jgi:alanine-glyoxylate transaminase/serine-glyoxylate transaminase/serine-pyruvate transaminase